MGIGRAQVAVFLVLGLVVEFVHFLGFRWLWFVGFVGFFGCFVDCGYL